MRFPKRFLSGNVFHNWNSKQWALSLQTWPESSTKALLKDRSTHTFWTVHHKEIKLGTLLDVRLLCGNLQEYVQCCDLNPCTLTSRNVLKLQNTKVEFSQRVYLPCSIPTQHPKRPHLCTHSKRSGTHFLPGSRTDSSDGWSNGLPWIDPLLKSHHTQPFVFEEQDELRFVALFVLREPVHGIVSFLHPWY